MNHRGSGRGVIQQHAASGGSPGPPGHRRRVPDPAADTGPIAATVPGPYASRASRPPRVVVPAPPPPTRTPPRRSRPPGGTALDSLDEQDERSSGFSWRDLIQRLTGIDLGPGRDRRYEENLRTRIRAVAGTAFPVAVLNLKGGVGKTSVVEALGSTFADVRHDRIIAVDIDAGDLAERHGRPNPLSLADLLADNAVKQYADVRAHTYMNAFGLEVLGLPDYARTAWRLQPSDVVKTLSILKHHYSVVLVDCVKALNSGETKAVLSAAGAVVVVTSPSIDAIRKTRTTLEWLRHNGYRHLLGSTILVINHVAPARVDTVAAKQLDTLSAGVAATVVLPFDRHIHDGKQIELDRLSKESRRSYLELAATLADMFPSRSRRHGREPVARSPHWP